MSRKLAIRAAGLGLLISTFVGNCARAADPTIDYLEALRARGWHDTALEYLESLGDQPDLSDSIRQRLPYERAVTLAASARSARSPVARQQQTGKAVEALEAFAQNRPRSVEAVEALRQAANLHAELAFAALAERTKLPRQAADQREQLAERARTAFGAAGKAAQAALDGASQQLESLPKPAEAQADPQAMASRRKLSSRTKQARALVARMLFESAKTYDPGAKPRKEALATAAKAFQQLFIDYGVEPVGFYGRLYEGRCYQEAGKCDEALTCYRDLLEVNSANPSFRQLAARALRGRLECLTTQGKVDEAIDDGRRWLQQSDSGERRQAEWLGIAFRLAEALNEAREQLSASDSQHAKLQSEARLLLRDVAKIANEFQQPARLALASLGHADGEGPRDYSDFGDAFAAAETALDLRKSSRLAARLAKENNPAAVAELERQAADNTKRATELFEQALALVRGDSDVNQVNRARYLLSILYWEQERLDEAAVLSIYVTRKFPDAPAAERAAQVALAAYEKLYRRARQAEQRDEADFLGGQLADLAKTIASRWPKSPQASTAVELLINIALADDRLAEAEALLARLPEQSKAAAQLSLGGALWRKYRYMTAAGKSSPTEDAAKLAGRAAELMQSGFAGARTNAAPSSALATGVLALAQSALTNGNAETALEALEDARIGPLALLEQGHAAVDRPDLAESIYQTALRTYVSLSPPRREEARRVMSSLEKLTGDGPQLTRMYVNLGFQLQRQIEGMAGAGEYESAREAAAVCEDLLERVSQRADADSWLIRNWVAQTNLQLGELLSDDQRQRYVKRAKEAYEGILATAQRDSQFAPKPGALLAIRKRLADCERGLGNYEKALDQYAAILKQKPTMLPLQQAAAECLQLQGSASKDIAPLKQSIAGAMAQRDGKNLIWGWARLAKQVNHAKSKAEAKLQKDPSAAASVQKYADLYFEARYNVAKSRFLMAKVGPPVQRRENLQAAKRSVTSMQALYPNLGGPKWKAAFEKLLGEIEQASG